MTDADKVLVVGAGPVGLAAALELTRFGQAVQIIEERRTRSAYSKAMGINTRTLELLEPSDVTRRLLERGLRIPRVRVSTGEQALFTIDFSRLPHRYNYMLGLPQSETERILETRLNELGVSVDRGVRFEQLHQAPDGVTAVVSRDGHHGELSARYLVGADGAHSRVRQVLNIDFPGTRMRDHWSLADIRAESTGDPEAARVVFGPDGVLFMLRFQRDIFRVASNRPDVLSRLPPELKAGEVLWQSEFQVSHRQAARYARDRVFLVGDAAHLHSPLGARGMNLGIEDACTLAVCIVNACARHYGRNRHRAGAAAIRMIRAQTGLATAVNPFARTVRAQVLPRLLHIGPLHDALARRMLGLGYETGDCDRLALARRDTAHEVGSTLVHKY